MKYSVRKETYTNKLIEDLGEMTIEEIKNLAYEYLNDVFKDEQHIKSVITYIEENGEEIWLCRNEVQIVIQKIEEVKDNEC